MLKNKNKKNHRYLDSRCDSLSTFLLLPTKRTLASDHPQIAQFS